MSDARRHVVSGSDGMLKHLAFFEELAQLEETNPAWQSVSAGLVTLRLIDAWVQEGAAVITADAWGLRAVRCAIEQMSEGDRARGILASAIDTLEASSVTDFRPVAPRLMAYAQWLEYGARWLLAADVYRMILAHTHPIDDCDIAVAANLRLGECYRNLNHSMEALEAYGAAGQVASSAGDIIGILRARIGEAHIAVMRGNLPQADAILEQTISEAGHATLTDVRSRALHDRAQIAYLRREYERSIRLAYEALEISTSSSERDRILGDIAAAFVELGVLSAAQDAYLVLAATAQEQYVRWLATVNLMNIASLEGREPLFERYRRSLVDVQLPPIGAVHYHLIIGQAYHRSFRLDEARSHLEAALELATRHQFNQLVFDAEESLRNLSHDAARVQPTAAADELDEVVTAIRKMREAAPV